MTHRPARPRRTPDRRGPITSAGLAGRTGFTLVEILVVVTIIAVLVSLVTVAGLGFVGQARAAATRTTIKKVEEAILERVSSVNRWHQRPVTRLQRDWQYRGWIYEWETAGLGAAANVADRQAGYLVLSRKGMLRELLPVTQDELVKAYWFWATFDTDGTLGLSAAERAKMTAFLADMDGDASNGAQSLDTPGEVFYYALTNAPVYGGRRIEEDEFSQSELVDPAWIKPDGTVSPQDGVMELGDAWGNPLRFYRWPTRLVNNYASPGSINPQDPSTWTWGSDVTARKTLIPNAPSEELDLHVDPDDRAGYLGAPQPVSFNNKLYTAPPVSFFHDPATWHAPLVLSAGPDGRTGLQEPDVAVGFVSDILLPGLAAPLADGVEAQYDNITNHSGRAGGL